MCSSDLGFGVAVHYADLVAQLVDEDADRFGFGDARGELAQRLRHQAGLQSHLGSDLVRKQSINLIN